MNQFYLILILLFCYSIDASAQLQEFLRIKECGLGYSHSSVLLGKKMAPYGLPYKGKDQPAALFINSIPSTAIIEKAYIWWDLTGSATEGTVTLQNPDSISKSYKGTLIGSGEKKCWGIGASAFRADITELVTGNGTYYISGLPTDSTFNASDVNGATLFVVYSDPKESFVGSLVIDDGYSMVKFDTIAHYISTIKNDSASAEAKAFMLISDLQNEQGTSVQMNNGPYLGIKQDYWDFEEKNTYMPANPDSSKFSVYAPKDCANLIMTGLYFKHETNESIPIITQKGDTLISSEAESYQWLINDSVIAGATNQQYFVKQTGNYQVQVTYNSHCTRFSDSVFVVGIKEQKKHVVLNLYPNPSNGIVVIEHKLNKAENLNIQLMNLSGQILKEWNDHQILNKQTVTLDLGEFHGLYLLRIYDLEFNYVRRVMILD